MEGPFFFHLHMLHVQWQPPNNACNSTPKLFFTNFLLILDKEASSCCHQLCAAECDANWPPCDIILDEMFLFLILALKMGHSHHDTSSEFWSRDSSCHEPLCSGTMQHNRFFRILPFLQFENWCFWQDYRTL
jgi:hypothetical protein